MLGVILGSGGVRHDSAMHKRFILLQLAKCCGSEIKVN